MCFAPGMQGVYFTSTPSQLITPMRNHVTMVKIEFSCVLASTAFSGLENIFLKTGSSVETSESVTLMSLFENDDDMTPNVSNHLWISVKLQVELCLHCVLSGIEMKIYFGMSDASWLSANLFYDGRCNLSETSAAKALSGFVWYKATLHWGNSVRPKPRFADFTGFISSYSVIALIIIFFSRRL